MKIHKWLSNLHGEANSEVSLCYALCPVPCCALPSLCPSLLVPPEVSRSALVAKSDLKVYRDFPS